MTTRVQSCMRLGYLFQLSWTGKSWRVRVFNCKHRCVDARVFKHEQTAQMYVANWSKS